MKQWILTTNGETQVFDEFLNAVHQLKNTIHKHVDFNKDVYGITCLPDGVGAFFGYKFDEGIGTDEEIVIEARLNQVLDSLHCEDPAINKEYIQKYVKKEIHYHGEIEEFDEKLDINTTLSNDEFVVDIVLDDADITYLKTNAFIFDDENKTYYFKTHQIINTSSNPNDLGKVVDLDASLFCHRN